MVAKEFIKMLKREGIDCNSRMKLINANECGTFKELLEKVKLESGKWEMETDAQFDVETLTKCDVAAILVPDDGNYYDPANGEDGRMCADYPADVTLSKGEAYVYLYKID